MIAKSRFRERAAAWFKRSEQQIDAALDVMLSNHSAAGRLQSGITIIRAIEIFEEETSKALGNCLVEAAKLIDHRGRRWSQAMDGIDHALEAQIGSARELLANPIKIADHRETPSIQAAADERIAEAGGRLRAQLSDFRDGWTAPVPKLWKDRHPFVYAVLLLLIGAAIGWVSSEASRLFGHEQDERLKPVRK